MGMLENPFLRMSRMPMDLLFEAHCTFLMDEFSFPVKNGPFKKSNLLSSASYFVKKALEESYIMSNMYISGIHKCLMLEDILTKKFISFSSSCLITLHTMSLLLKAKIGPFFERPWPLS